MVNIIWVSLTVIGLVFAMCNGTLQDVNEAVFKGAKEAITISFGLMSVLVFWLGLMKIAEQSGLLDIDVVNEFKLDIIQTSLRLQRNWTAINSLAHLHGWAFLR